MLNKKVEITLEKKPSAKFRHFFQKLNNDNLESCMHEKNDFFFYVK